MALEKGLGIKMNMQINVSLVQTCGELSYSAFVWTERILILEYCNQPCWCLLFIELLKNEREHKITLQRKHFTKRNLECSICTALYPPKIKKQDFWQSDYVTLFPSLRETDVCNLFHILQKYTSNFKNWKLKRQIKIWNEP